MNAVESIFARLSDEELSEIVQELADLRVSGVLRTGRTNALAGDVARLTGLSYSTALNIACSEPLFVAALRWAGMAQPQKESPLEPASVEAERQRGPCPE
jgi:hypothetical protein